MACSEADYVYLRDIVHAQSANAVDSARRSAFETRLAPLARRAGAQSLEDLVGMLRVDRSTRLHRAVAEAMTINETSFFRDGKPFELLRHTILPRLLQHNRRERTLRLWSAASSTGQEAYSLAMLLCEYFPELAEWNVKIVGTDLSQQVVDYAQRGRYKRIEINRGLPARHLLKYFTREGEEWQVSPRLRAMCRFEVLNLCEPLPRMPLFDLVLLRNVLLYFPQQDRSRVFAAVQKQMVPEGYLLLGAAEQAEDSTRLFRAEFAGDCYFYRPASGE